MIYVCMSLQFDQVVTDIFFCWLHQMPTNGYRTLDSATGFSVSLTDQYRIATKGGIFIHIVPHRDEKCFSLSSLQSDVPWSLAHGSELRLLYFKYL